MAVKKKWSKGKVKDKAQHAVVFEKAVFEKLQKDVQTYRLITVATLVDRLKINGSLARKALNDLEAEGQIKKVVSHSKLNIYSTFPIPQSTHPHLSFPLATINTNRVLLFLARAVAAE
ncbi:hypothetical protein N7462_006103 [Penicillium macrosclerotiorum]|uniref:uncharacterized protein n=1 Tax=Penicillium macrosclerotiorum TaxID=303699 RepID=UPI00254969DC|nr:uncharacterized protein N7462_006103 [Penicillium macrosclerotiorum]KAJ5682938.1 hypothetical protein N7462_006103 [Penicillium macrosclerotiorum]